MYAIHTRYLAHYAAITLAILGFGWMWWFLSAAPLGVKMWNAFPYALCVVLTFTFRTPLPAAIAVIWMLLIDGFVTISALLQIKTPWLLALSLVDTLKSFVVLPIGILVGWCIQTSCRSSTTKNEAW